MLMRVLGSQRGSKSCLGGLLEPKTCININVDVRLRAQTGSKSCLGWFRGLKKPLWDPKRVRIMSGLALGVQNAQKIKCRSGGKVSQPPAQSQPKPNFNANPNTTRHPPSSSHPSILQCSSNAPPTLPESIEIYRIPIENLTNTNRLYHAWMDVQAWGSEGIFFYVFFYFPFF